MAIKDGINPIFGLERLFTSSSLLRRLSWGIEIGENLFS